VTMDHVLPKSWYPKDMPDDVNRWTAPSCKPCNHSLGVIERELKIRFGFCLPPDHPALWNVIHFGSRSITHAVSIYLLHSLYGVFLHHLYVARVK